MDINPLATFSLLFMDDLKANFGFFIEKKNKSIHDGVDLKLLKRQEIFPLISWGLGFYLTGKICSRNTKFLISLLWGVVRSLQNLI